MRKRIVIALSVLAVIGVGGYVLSRPRKGSVEYHKVKLSEGQTSLDRWIKNYSPSRVKDYWFRRRGAQADFHRKALIQLGYFEERVFVLSNCFSDEVIKSLPDTNTNFELTDTFDVGSTMIKVVGPTNAIRAWEGLIREVDRPQEPDK